MYSYKIGVYIYIYIYIYHIIYIYYILYYKCIIYLSGLRHNNVLKKPSVHPVEVLSAFHRKTHKLLSDSNPYQEKHMSFGIIILGYSRAKHTQTYWTYLRKISIKVVEANDSVDMLHIKLRNETESSTQEHDCTSGNHSVDIYVQFSCSFNWW